MSRASETVDGKDAGCRPMALIASEIHQPPRPPAAHHRDRAAAGSAPAEIDAQLRAPGPEAGVPAPAARTGGRGPGVPAIRGLTVKTPDGRPALDRLDLTAMPEAGLRRRIACIARKPRIFHGTITDDMRFARPETGGAELRATARRASVTAFADDLPRGLSRPVGEGGIGLSGGEAQRVALARLFLADPDPTLLDEPTAGRTAIPVPHARLPPGTGLRVPARRGGVFEAAP